MKEKNIALKNKNICKTCENLIYWDGYLCSGKESTFYGQYIKDINNDFCEAFQKHEGRFWLFDTGEF